ncbi:ABC transporter ATP-binding protein [Schaalia sp. ZJ1691]|uniref:ABC transporter ATP-binding protein n=1 Tax=Schaalia sp. ZJ1691 TaxID=2709404 RepID=UPI0013EA9FD0|nr:ABC transporter ATP-binding protein [Schaalia sp. ZJ1691]
MIDSTRIFLDRAGFSYGHLHTRDSWMSDSPRAETSENPRLAAELPVAVRDVSLTVKPGEVVLLCGPSGCGKSTILRMVNGLAPEFYPGTLSGVLRVCGRDIGAEGLVATAELTTTVFQNPRTQFFTSEVLTELAFRGENSGEDPGDLRRRCDEALSDLGIRDLRDRALSELSGGQLQRVACAQALVGGTPVVLLDEPTSNLSPEGIHALAEVIRILRDREMAVLIAEHRLWFLRGIADRVILLSDGRVTQSWQGHDFFAMTPQQRRDVGLRSLVEPSFPLLDAGGHGGEPGSAPSGAVVMNEDEVDLSPSTLGEYVLGRGVEIENLRFSYGKRRVLDIDRLEFPAGVITAVLGENGAGKSTLARVLCGLAQPERGSKIRVDGEAMSRNDLIRSCSFVMQDVGRQLFAETIRRDVSLGIEGRDRAEEIDRLLDDFDLGDVADRHPLAVSGGQRQRAAIVGAVASGRRVTIFDEPTSGVDLRHLESIAQTMRQLANAGHVVVVITHDAELVDACADRVVVLAPT